MVIGLNFRGVWIGKELQGSINRDGTKILALQITAKLHELLMLASLGDFLGSFLLELMVLNKGAPFGALLIEDQFSKISYLWSSGYIATCMASFNKKSSFIILVTVCTLLGILVGPSSATAMAPSLDNWLTDQLMLPIGIAEDRLWPMELSEGNELWDGCFGTVQTCSEAKIWNTVASNMFAYWGHQTIGGIHALPEFVMVPSSDTLRTIHARFRGPINLYQPDITVATIQTASIANMITNLRMLWFAFNDEQCDHGKGLCNYKDITWAIDTVQPVVYSACNLVQDNEDYWLLPNMTRINGTLSTATISPIAPASISPSLPSLQWFEPIGYGFQKLSTGVVVHLPNLQDSNNSTTYVCGIDAQWANSSVTTTFLGSPYVVDGFPPYFFIPDAEGSTFKGRRVKIEASWADAAVPVTNTRQNQSAFETLYNSGIIPDTEDASSKIEAALAVLIATSMAQVYTNMSLDLSSLNNSRPLAWTDLRTIPRSNHGTNLRVSVIATGYAYGLFTADNFAVGRFLALLTLIAYSAVVLVCLAFRIIQRQPFIEVWDDLLGLIWLTMRTSNSSSNGNGSGSNATSLCNNIRLMQKTDQMEIVMEPLLKGNSDFLELEEGKTYI